MANEYVEKNAALDILKEPCKNCIYTIIADTGKCPDCRINIEMIKLRKLPTLTVHEAISIICDHCKSNWPACVGCELNDWCDMVDSHLSPRNWEV